MKRLTARRLAYAGMAWSVSYLPIHVYWALGGRSRPIGIDGSVQNFRTANWGACFVILGAGLVCLALVHPWGRLLPRRVRAGAAWVGGVFAGLHWAVFTLASTLRLVGVVAYPAHGHPTATQSRAYDWWNLGYFELWFGVMGVLLIACAVLTRSAAGRPLRPADRLGSTVTLAGVATVIWGVFTFEAWIFALAGPAVLAVGLLILHRSNDGAGSGRGELRTPSTRVTAWETMTYDRAPLATLGGAARRIIRPDRRSRAADPTRLGRGGPAPARRPRVGRARRQ